MQSNMLRKVSVKYFRVPIEGNLVDALHGTHTHFELITATVRLESGAEGTGYTYTGGFGGAAIANMIERDLAPQLLGKVYTSPKEMNAFMNQCIHYVARGGIASFAISALDIAFHDIQLTEMRQPLCATLTDSPSKVRTYYGGIDLALTESELLRNIELQMQAGHTAFKIKVGKEDENEDVARIRSVRRLIGDEALFMVDANMVWSIEQAIRMCKKMEEFDLTWLEEPTNPDDYIGYARIGQASSIPIAMGENLHTVCEHKLAIDIGRISYPIPDCSNICGITGFLQVADLCKEYSLLVSSHGMQELHVNVLAGLPHRGYLEFHSFPIWQYTQEPLRIENGYLEPSKQPGVGVRFDWKALSPYQV